MKAYTIFIFLTIFFRFTVNAQNLVSQDTIFLTDNNFRKVIEFRNEELYDLSGEVEKYAICYADADSLRQFLADYRQDLFSKNFFNDEELEGFETNFNKYLHGEFQNKDTLVVIRPGSFKAMESRNVLNDFNYAIFYLLRRDYYKKALVKGQIKFRLTENNKYPTKIIVNKYERIDKEMGNFIQTWKYILHGTEFEVFSHSKHNRIDESKKYLSHSDPIQWEFEIKQIREDLYRVILRAKLVELWEIYAIEQPKNNGVFPTSITFNPSNDYDLVGEIKEPKIKVQFDKRFNNEILSHIGLVEFTQDIRLKTDNPKVTGHIIFMVGNIESIKAPEEKKFEITMK